MIRRGWRSRGRLSSLRPGVVLALAVTSVVGVTGILRWDLELITVGLMAGIVIIAINGVLVLTRHWHRRNTDLHTTYRRPEDAVRLRRQGHAAGGAKRR